MNDSWKKRPPDNKVKLSLDHMDSGTRVGEIVDASSSYFQENTHSMYTDQEGGGLIF